AGDVIPQIVGPAGPHVKGTRPFKMPKKCPLCGANVVKPEGEAMHRCPNRACPSRGLETLINWVQGPAELDGFQEKSASNTIDAIDRSKGTPFSRVLLGLNIPDVGWVTAQNLTRHFGTIDRIAAASQEDIQEVEGIGPERAEAIAEWFSDKENLRLIDELQKIGLRFEAGPEERPVE